MSASLVGSEMCIRDRARSSRAATSTWTLRTSYTPWAPSTSCWATTGTVSYTHLTLPTICSV
eukprot:8598125-Alexandrium_andersonii.AAC.1